MPVEHVKIKNFRSLSDVSIDTKTLTVFVGCNDEGKSNILRSLDLFFNFGKGYKLNWELDYSGFARNIRNKAQQIEVAITFALPASFNLKQRVVWKRVWRRTGLHEEVINLADGKRLPSRSKAYAYLKSIRYEYIPAIKGPEYFEKLLSSVHDMLDSTVRAEIRSAASDFTSEIRRHTSGMLADLEEKLNLKSDLELPGDLRQLFSELEFRSTTGDNGHRVSLSQRGDGIKVRHIPVILRWLADQANHLSAPGRPRVVTIWGYEEPENNLETRRCFELAQFFVETSSKIQTFLTTHSPVFYSVLRSPDLNEVALAEIKLDASEGTKLTPRTLSSESDVDALHSSIGFLEVLEPYVRQWKTKADHLQARIDEGISKDYPTIFVEGPSDKVILEKILAYHFPEASTVKVLCSQKNGGGHSWVKDSLIAWHHIRAEHPAVGLFDDDEASRPSIDEFQELIEKRANGKTKASKYKIKPAGLALDIVKKKIRLPVAIEEICPKEAWAKAKKNDWLTKRASLPALYGFNETEMTFNDWLRGKLSNEEEMLVACYKVHEDHKEKFSKHVANNIGTTNWDFKPLIELADALLKKINIK